MQRHGSDIDVAIFDDKDLDTMPILCTVCNMWLNGIVQVKDHIGSTKHIRMQHPIEDNDGKDIKKKITDASGTESEDEEVSSER